MDRILEGLHATAVVDLGFGDPPLKAWGYLVERDAGNVIVYNGAALLAELDAVRALGGASAQLLNHVHEATGEAGDLRDALGAPLWVGAADAADTERTVSVDGTFDGPLTLGDAQAGTADADGDLDVIPIPGHTPGATAFLWRGREARVLFTGDSLTLDVEGRWVAALLDGISDREDYIASLERLADVEFDLLAPGAGREERPVVARTDPADARERIGAVVDRLRAGGDR